MIYRRIIIVRMINIFEKRNYILSTVSFLKVSCNKFVHKEKKKEVKGKIIIRFTNYRNVRFIIKADFPWRRYASSRASIPVPSCEKNCGKQSRVYFVAAFDYREVCSHRKRVDKSSVAAIAKQKSVTNGCPPILERWVQFLQQFLGCRFESGSLSVYLSKLGSNGVLEREFIEFDISSGNF